MLLRNQFMWWPCAVLALAAGSATADPGTASPLKRAFEAAWQRQPEALSQQARQDAAAAQQQAAARWTAEPVALELSNKSDRFNQNLGRDETVAGISIPLWLPGERAGSIALADAQAQASASQLRAAQLRTAGEVREAYWALARARTDHALAVELKSHTQQLAQDVARRVRAGELARADQHQADGAVAAAQVAQAEAADAVASATQRLRAMTGPLPQPETPLPASAAEPVPAAEADIDADTDAKALYARHPALAALQHRADVARRNADLARVQTRANPELTLATGRDRGLRDDAYQHSITLGLRIPLGADSRNQAKRASAQADAVEAQAEWLLARERLHGAVEVARAGLASAQTRLQAAQQRALLARESRGFFQKSYRLGETDLPTRLRMEREAMDAERQAARATIDLAAAQSSLRQTLGLLPQ